LERAGKLSIVSRINNAFGPVECALGMIQRQIADELLGADPSPAGKQTLEMKRAERDRIRDFF